MILVEVSVPAINGNYDFKIDENAYIADVIQEMGIIIFNSDMVNNAQMIENLILCDYNNRRIFTLNLTLKDYDIRSGAKLVLI